MIFPGEKAHYQYPSIFIDVVPDVVIWTVNWLYYLNYEGIPHSSITCH